MSATIAPTCTFCSLARLRHGDRRLLERSAHLEPGQRISLRFLAHGVHLVGQRGGEQRHRHQQRRERQPHYHQRVERRFAILLGGHRAFDDDRQHRPDEELERAHGEQEQDHLVEEILFHLARRGLRAEREDQAVAGIGRVEPGVVIGPVGRADDQREAEHGNQEIGLEVCRLAVARADGPDDRDRTDRVEHVHGDDRRHPVRISGEMEDEETDRARSIGRREDDNPGRAGLAPPKHEERDSEHCAQHWIRHGQDLFAHRLPQSSSDAV